MAIDGDERSEPRNSRRGCTPRRCRRAPRVERVDLAYVSVTESERRLLEAQRQGALTRRRGSTAPRSPTRLAQWLPRWSPPGSWRPDEPAPRTGLLAAAGVAGLVGGALVGGWLVLGTRCSRSRPSRPSSRRRRSPSCSASSRVPGSAAIQRVLMPTCGWDAGTRRVLPRRPGRPPPPAGETDPRHGRLCGGLVRRPGLPHRPPRSRWDRRELHVGRARAARRARCVPRSRPASAQVAIRTGTASPGRRRGRTCSSSNGGPTGRSHRAEPGLSAARRGGADLPHGVRDEARVRRAPGIRRLSGARRSALPRGVSKDRAELDEWAKGGRPLPRSAHRDWNHQRRPVRRVRDAVPRRARRESGGRGASRDRAGARSR